MAYVVTLEGFRPVARYDLVPWTQARIEESATATGTFAVLQTQALSPVDSDPSMPAVRNLTVNNATLQSGWYRVVFIDAISNESSPVGPVYVAPVSLSQSAGLSLLAMRTQVKAEGGFGSAQDAQVNGWINDRYKDMVARSGWRTGEVDLGPTVANQAAYDLPRDVVDVSGLTVDTVPFERVGVKDIWNVRANKDFLSRGVSGVFAPAFSAGATPQLDLYPAPSASGQAITALAVLLPPDLLSDSDVPIVPVDFHRYLVVGALATGFARYHERLDTAMPYEQEFEQSVERLRRRMNSRVGSGPIRIPVVR